MAPAVSHKKRKTITMKEETVSQTLTRKTTTKGKRNRAAGRLAGMVDLPLDVLFEIFGHLNPMDLLRLCRTTKELRRVLMHRSSRSVWVAARGHLPDLPDILSGMSEPAWANLVFDPHCHFCLTSNIQNVEWQWRVRICKKCYNAYAKYVIADSTACSRALHREGAELLSAFQSVSHLLPHQFLSRGRPSELIERPELMYLVHDYEQTIASLKEAVADGPDSLQDYIGAKEEAHNLIKKEVSLCIEWDKKEANRRFVEYTSIRAKRKEAIIVKLKDLGWEEEFNLMGAHTERTFGFHRIIYKKQLLTERIWKNIQGPLTDYMADIKSQRLVREQAELIGLRMTNAVEHLRNLKKAALPLTQILPCAFTWCSYTPIKAIIGQSSDVAVDFDSFSHLDLANPLSDHIVDWRLGIYNSLYDIVKASAAERNGILWNLSGSNEHVSPLAMNDTDALGRLKLATTVFGCKRCGLCMSHDHPDYSRFRKSGVTKAMCYPDVMTHICLTRSKRNRYDPGFSSTDALDPSSWINDDGDPYCYRGLWNAESLCLDLRLGLMAERLVKTVGLDPFTTTAVDMDALHIRFTCKTCAANRFALGHIKLDCFGWRSAIDHNTEHHPDTFVEWIALDKPCTEEQLARSDTSWSCFHCCDTPNEGLDCNLSDVIDHLRYRHGISPPVLNLDYFRAFGAPPALSTSKGWLEAKNMTQLRLITRAASSSFP